MKNISDKDINELQKAVNSGNVNDFIDKRLTPEQSAKIKRVLSDKNAAEKLLQSPQARELMKKLRIKRGKNGRY